MLANQFQEKSHYGIFFKQKNHAAFVCSACVIFHADSKSGNVVHVAFLNLRFASKSQKEEWKFQAENMIREDKMRNANSNTLWTEALPSSQTVLQFHIIIGN